MISRFVEPVLTKSTAYLISWRFLRSRCRNQESKSKNKNIKRYNLNKRFRNSNCKIREFDEL